jgi:multicomponent Na+:H+ antiporter subunit B
MRSLILQTAMPFLVSLTVLFSIFVLFRGHNEPGGGFIGGLIAASALATYMMAEGPRAVRRSMGWHPIAVASLGVFLGAISGVIALYFEEPFLTGMWYIPDYAPDFKLIASPVLFDIGVYLTVVGTITAIALALDEGD